MRFLRNLRSPPFVNTRCKAVSKVSAGMRKSDEQFWRHVLYVSGCYEYIIGQLTLGVESKSVVRTDSFDMVPEGRPGCTDSAWKADTLRMTPRIR